MVLFGLALKAYFEHPTLSDGGEGLVKCVERMAPTHRVVLPVHGPLMEIVEASYAIAVDGTTA